MGEVASDNGFGATASDDEVLVETINCGDNDVVAMCLRFFRNVLHFAF